MTLQLQPHQEMIRQYLKTYLQRAIPGRPIEPALDGFLRILVSYHPKADQKIGPGISHFFIKMHPRGGLAYHAKQIDGTVHSFSYIKCLTAFPKAQMPSHLQLEK